MDPGTAVDWVNVPTTGDGFASSRARDHSLDPSSTCGSGGPGNGPGYRPGDAVVLAVLDIDGGLTDPQERDVSRVDTPTSEVDELVFHQPVMVRETLDHLLVKPDGVYVDGTVGEGGHSAAVLRNFFSPVKGRTTIFFQDKGVYLSL